MTKRTNAGEESEFLARAVAETRDRLRSRNVILDGHESSDQLADLLDAVDRFDRAVEHAGGDLMVDEAPQGKEAQPDNPRFVLPRRKDKEAVAAYIVRILMAADGLRPGKGKR